MIRWKNNYQKNLQKQNLNFLFKEYTDFKHCLLKTK